MLDATQWEAVYGLLKAIEIVAKDNELESAERLATAAQDIMTALTVSERIS